MSNGWRQDLPANDPTQPKAEHRPSSSSGEIDSSLPTSQGDSWNVTHRFDKYQDLEANGAVQSKSFKPNLPWRKRSLVGVMNTIGAPVGGYMAHEKKDGIWLGHSTSTPY